MLDSKSGEYARRLVDKLYPVSEEEHVNVWTLGQSALDHVRCCKRLTTADGHDQADVIAPGRPVRAYDFDCSELIGAELGSGHLQPAG